MAGAGRRSEELETISKRGLRTAAAEVRRELDRGAAAGASGVGVCLREFSGASVPDRVSPESVSLRGRPDAAVVVNLRAVFQGLTLRTEDCAVPDSRPLQG